MSDTLRTKLINQLQAKNNPNTGGFFDNGKISVEKRVWNNVYFKALASAAAKSGMTIIGGPSKPQMTNADWALMQNHIVKFVQGKKNAYITWMWKSTKQTPTVLTLFYKRNNKALVRNPNPKGMQTYISNNRDINAIAVRMVSDACVDFFKKSKFKKTAAKDLTLLTAKKTGATAKGQIEEHGARGEDEFSDTYTIPGRGQFSKTGSQRKRGRQAQITKDLKDGNMTSSGARGTRVEQRIVKSLADNMQEEAKNPIYYGQFFKLAMAKWRDMFNYDSSIIYDEKTSKYLKRTLVMQSSMVPKSDSFNPGEYDKAIAADWRLFLKNNTYFRTEAQRLLPGSMTAKDIDDLFSDSPPVSKRLIAAANKQIVQGLFTQVTNPDMRLKVNKALLRFGTKSGKSRTSQAKMKGSRSRTRAKPAKAPAGAVVAAGARQLKTEQKAGANPMALRNLLNEMLPQVVARNMVAPALQYRTGRFANSVRVEGVTQGPRGGNTMIEASYRTDPYETFAPGGRKYTQQRDPERLIKRSIREIATSLVGARFGITIQ